MHEERTICTVRWFGILEHFHTHTYISTYKYMERLILGMRNHTCLDMKLSMFTCMFELQGSVCPYRHEYWDYSMSGCFYTGVRDLNRSVSLCGKHPNHWAISTTSGCSTVKCRVTPATPQGVCNGGVCWLGTIFSGFFLSFLIVFWHTALPCSPGYPQTCHVVRLVKNS